MNKKTLKNFLRRETFTICSCLIIIIASSALISSALFTFNKADDKNHFFLSFQILFTIPLYVHLIPSYFSQFKGMKACLINIFSTNWIWKVLRLPFGKPFRGTSESGNRVQQRLPRFLGFISIASKGTGVHIFGNPPVQRYRMIFWMCWNLQEEN